MLSKVIHKNPHWKYRDC